MGSTASPGKLIVFEGPDGVGKTTLATAAARCLESEGVGCEIMSFPGRTLGTLGKLVYDLHHSPGSHGVERLTAASTQTLHVAAHLDAIERVIRPTLNSGRYVILDRFWWSTWVYGRVDGLSRRMLKRLIDLELCAWEELRPAAVILVRRDEPVDRDVSLKEWRRLCDGYAALAGKEGRKYKVLTLENSRGLAEAEEAVCSEVRRLTVLATGDAGTLGANVQPVDVKSRSFPAAPTEVFDTYWRFAAERQSIFFRRLLGEGPPWTDDPVLSEYKFTNAYRASDRVSQYLIRSVIYRDDLPSDAAEVFFRIILFKLFNKIETWQMLEEKFGAVTFADYSFARYDAVLTAAMAAGRRVYSAAYIMPSGGSALGHPVKHRNHLSLVELMMADDLPGKIAGSPTMRAAFDLLRSYPTLGNFLAYQFVTDVNYSTVTDFDEMEFVVPGPGALDGIRKCFRDLNGLTESDVIRAVADRQEAEFTRLGLEFHSLWGRRLQLIDCQNLFCEVDKYARVMHPEVSGVSGRTRIKQKYAGRGRASVEYWYPPKWGINEAVGETLRQRDSRQPTDHTVTL